MIKRAIVNVTISTPGRNYIVGQRRLLGEFPDETKIMWSEQLPTYSPSHAQIPYAFKAWALKAAQCQHRVDTVLWTDACIISGPRPLKELWEHVEREGYWICNNGYTNYEWTAESAYPDLFPGIKDAKEENAQIPHAVGTAFGLNLQSTICKAFLDEYLRLAQTDAFKGPWVNANHEEGKRQLEYARRRGIPAQGVASCGPPDVRGHRHDQTAISVIAWELGMQLTNAPEWFSYANYKPENTSSMSMADQSERSCLIAAGRY